jgi:hypothetical protein
VIAANVFKKKVAGRAGEPVEPRHRHHVAGVDDPEQAAKLRAFGLGTARHFAEHLFASGPGELAHLRLDALAIGRDAGIAVFHAAIMQQIYAAKKRNRFNELVLLRFS